MKLFKAPKSTSALNFLLFITTNMYFASIVFVPSTIGFDCIIYRDIKVFLCQGPCLDLAISLSIEDLTCFPKALDLVEISRAHFLALAKILMLLFHVYGIYKVCNSSPTMLFLCIPYL